MATRVAINGFGRIGRLTLRAILERPGRQLDVVAVNDIADAQTLAYLLQHDSVYGPYRGEIELQGDSLAIDDRRVRVLNVKDPQQLPWRDMGVEVVLESSGAFTRRAGEGKGGYDSHLAAGARKVVLSAPAKDAPDATVVLGVNEELLTPDVKLVSNASCTTNSLAPVLKVLHDRFGVVRGVMTTVHAYTSSQSLVDAPAKRLTRGRAAALNIVPTTTGAAKAIGEVIPALQGKLDGLALRVPVPCGSITDLNVVVEKDATVEGIHDAMRQAAQGPMKGILRCATAPLVSSDIVQDPHSAIYDGQNTLVMDGKLVKVTAWYDNEWGFACRCADMMERLARL